MAQEVLTNQIHIVLPLIVGVLIGILEVIFVMKDETGTLGENLIKDGWHGFTTSILGTLIASNVPYVLNLISLPDKLVSLLMIDPQGRSIVVSSLITIILIAKMVVSKSIKGGLPGVKEKFIHKLIIGALAGFSPYYIFMLYPMIEPYLGSIPFL